MNPLSINIDLDIIIRVFILLGKFLMHFKSKVHNISTNVFDKDLDLNRELLKSYLSTDLSFHILNVIGNITSVAVYIEEFYLSKIRLETQVLIKLYNIYIYIFIYCTPHLIL